MPQEALYDRLGQREGLTNLVDTYLKILQTEPSVAELYSHYQRGLEHYRARMIEYLSGYLGGPALYLQNHGLPMLREQHQRMKIDAHMRDLWYHCMVLALNASVADADLRQELEAIFWAMADSLKNT